VELVRSKMRLMFTSQRSDINMGMTGGIAMFEMKWPFLFEPAGLFTHGEELPDFHVYYVLKESLNSKGQRMAAT
jgi:hypothetical protein